MVWNRNVVFRGIKCLFFCHSFVLFAYLFVFVMVLFPPHFVGKSIPPDDKNSSVVSNENENARTDLKVYYEW
jgi:hypothetical protein